VVQKSQAVNANSPIRAPFAADFARLPRSRALVPLTVVHESGAAGRTRRRAGSTLPPHFEGPKQPATRVKRNGSCDDVAFEAILPPLALWKMKRVKKRRMHWATKRALIRKVRRKLTLAGYALAGGAALSAATWATVPPDNSLSRIQAGQWVVASMYWQDKLVSSGKTFQPVGLHAAHKTLPIGTLVRVSNPKNHRSINITINDRGPFIEGRDLDLTLGAGALLGFSGLGPLFLEVLALPGEKKIDRPLVENLFASDKPNDRSAPSVGPARAELTSAATVTTAAVANTTPAKAAAPAKTPAATAHVAPARTAATSPATTMANSARSHAPAKPAAEASVERSASASDHAPVTTY
jgi:rare lipoprotein A (peptidoglycan hydrolase)